MFVHGIMSVFYKDLISTSHTRKAEINTMTTSSGIALRKVVLDMHNDLANEVIFFIIEIVIYEDANVFKNF